MKSSCMRFVVLGAGAVGGTIGGRLRPAWPLRAPDCPRRALRGDSRPRPSTPVSRRHPHADSSGCRSARPRISWTADDVLLLATKTQDTEAALDTLASVAPPTLPIFCVQNSVANERMASDRFANVYGVFVWCPTDYLTPGLVKIWCAPKSGILHIGRYPTGIRCPGRGRRRRVARIVVLFRVEGRHHAMEVSQAAVEPRQCRRGALRRRGARQRVGAAGAARGARVFHSSRNRACCR